ncbi:MAG TPA: cyclodeaminase/cyclohydrolase family protein [Clostridia bacterium]|nr:cyclodeaminase/cyclohydrolase family protein [Clostridia bacterium]
MEDFTQLSCRDFVTVLSSAQPVPGGGGASALVGAIGMALGNMVGSLTVGKKKYAAVQDDIIRLKQQADALQTTLLALVAEDADAFEPLSQAYGMPTTSEEEKQEKQRVLEQALYNACKVPLKIMESCGECILLHHEFAEKGTVMALSDVGVGTALCKAGLMGASMNVFINTKAMKNRRVAEEINQQTMLLLNGYIATANELYQSILARLA